MISPPQDEDLQRAALAELDLLLDIPRDQRGPALATMAHSRPALHALVVGLLEHETTIERGFMEPAPQVSGVSLRPDSRLGPYRIIRLLGEGGMGAVWLANRDDGLYEGQVAIKTLHPYFAGGALRERFLREAQVLGRLAHSNIARLLDAGVHDGVVYLVLEYVVGRPLDVACDEDRLGVSARLRIFQQLCAAVAHAHSSLVVHRDIKPGNVLVNAQGAPKLLDFGIASFYEPEKGEAPSGLTRLTGRIFTPEYAAPEQVLGQEITTATDVYSLGVLLFVLLTGQLPYKPSDGESTAWEHAVLHSEPNRMSRAVGAEDLAAKRSTTARKLRRELDGDLEHIVQKALRKRPADRYLTVAALADDIHRHLQGEPVLARDGSGWYRLGRFARRHRLAVGSAAAVVVALGAGLAMALTQLQVADRERRHAEEVTEFAASIFRSADPFYTGNQSMNAADLLTLARRRIDQDLATQPAIAVELLTLVGESQVNLGQTEDGKAALLKAIQLAERQQPVDEILVAEARGRLAVLASNSGDWAETRALAAQALPALRKYQPKTSRVLNDTLSALGYAESDEGKPEEAVKLSREAVSAVTSVLGPAHSESISSRVHLGTFLRDADQLVEARTVAEEVLRDARALASPGERGALLVQAEDLYADVLSASGEYQEAIPHINSAIELSTQLYGPKNGVTYRLLSDLGRTQQRLGDFKNLLVTRRRAYEASEGEQPQSRMLTNLGRATFAARQLPQALELLREAVEREKQHDTGKGTWRFLAQSDYGSALALSGNFGQADRVLSEALPLARNAVMEGSLASTLNAIGLTRQLQLQWAESERAFREALEKTDKADANQKHRAEALQGIGLARLELGQAAEAEDWLRQADEAVRKTFIGMTPLRADIAMNLGKTMLAQGKLAAANEVFAAANSYWLDYDATNRGAGLAAYWMGQGKLADGRRQEARVELARAVQILRASALPGDVRLVTEARRALGSG
jgi:serine/threonine protein kinase